MHKVVSDKETANPLVAEVPAFLCPQSKQTKQGQIQSWQWFQWEVNTVLAASLSGGVCTQNEAQEEKKKD